MFDNQQIGVITRRDNHDNISVQFSGDEGLETTLNVTDIEDKIVELALLRPLSAIPDARVDDYIRPYQANWFWNLSLKTGGATAILCWPRWWRTCWRWRR